MKVEIDLALPLHDQFHDALAILRRLRDESLEMGGLSKTRDRRGTHDLPASDMHFLVFSLRHYGRLTEELTADILDIVAPVRRRNSRILEYGGGAERVHTAYHKTVKKLRKAKLLPSRGPSPDLETEECQRRAARLISTYLKTVHPTEYQELIKPTLSTLL